MLTYMLDAEQDWHKDLSYLRTPPERHARQLPHRRRAPIIMLQPVDGITWVVIWATAIVFGAWHGLQYSNGSFGFDVMSALFPLLGSIPGCWLRFKTGSFLFPILAHSFANVAFLWQAALSPNRS